MIRLLACTLALCVDLFLCVAMVSIARADDSPPGEVSRIQLPIPKGDSRAAKELAAICTAANASLREMKSEDRDRVFSEITAKILAHADKYPTDDSTLEGLAAVASPVQGFTVLDRGPKGRDELRNQAIERIRANFAKSQAIRNYLLLLARGPVSPADDLLRDVFKNHSDQPTRILAARLLIGAMDSRLSLAKKLYPNAEVRAKYEELMGKEMIQLLIETHVVDAKELDELRKQLKGILPDLENGTAAPETVGINLEGKQTKLSELRGKVVVLNFWATNKRPSQAVIPHNRELVKRMEGKPFVFVSICGDNEKKTLTEFLAKEPMPWTHWWDPQLTIADQWDVTGIPTLFVIDHKGVIQFQTWDYEEKTRELDEKINELVKAAEAGK